MPVRLTITSSSNFVESSFADSGSAEPGSAEPGSAVPGFIVPSWDAPATVRAVTTTRAGGYSKAPFAGFNLANHVGDEPGAVQRNRALLSDALNLPAPPVWLDQTHGIDIVTLSPADTAAPIAADGSVTSERGVVCAVMTADCLPLFLCNKQGTRVAAVHVGWRGMADGIIEAAVAAMNEPPEELFAWAGPCISVEHFEIGEDVKLQLAGPIDAYRAAGQSRKYYADLPQLAAHRLNAVGVGKFGYSECCTFDDEKQFFSHRRDQQTGRMASLIWMEPQPRL